MPKINLKKASQIAVVVAVSSTAIYHIPELIISIG
jgi:hypothetical protein